MPSLPNVLAAYEARWVLPYFTALTPVLGDFLGADLRIAFRPKGGCRAFAGNPRFVRRCLPLALFFLLEVGLASRLVPLFQACNALISAPMIPLITKVKLANLPDAERRAFPFTPWEAHWAGCVVALVSALAFDHSADAGRLATGIRG